MGILDIFTKKQKKQNDEQRSYSPFGLNSLIYNSSSSYVESKSMLLSAVYRCVDVISDSVAQLPLEPFKIDSDGYKKKYTKHPTYYLLNREPNEEMSRFTFMKTLITSVLLKGNGFALIERDAKGDATAIKLIPSEYVTIQEVNGNIMYGITGYKHLIESINMIHILNFSYDGINGISTLSHARNTLGLATDSEAHASGFFKGGANLAGIITVQSSLTPKQKQDIKTGWQSTFSPITGTPNGVAVLEGNMTFQPITVNPADAQLLETREFNVIDICRFFGVSPVKAMSLDTLLPTPTGWTTIEKVKVGDTLFDRYGKPTKVIYKTNIFENEDTYKLTFSDGTDVTVGYDHLWVAIKAGRAKRGEKVYTTKEMFDYQEKYGRKFRIPKNGAIEYPENKNLKVDS